MNRALKIRLTEKTLAQLELVADTLGSTKNRLIQRAVDLFLQDESTKLAEQLTPRLIALRKYSAGGDEARRAAIRTAVEAEAEFGKDDPVEGAMITGTPDKALAES